MAVLGCSSLARAILLSSPSSTKPKMAFRAEENLAASVTHEVSEVRADVEPKMAFRAEENLAAFATDEASEVKPDVEPEISYGAEDKFASPATDEASENKDDVVPEAVDGEADGEAASVHIVHLIRPEGEEPEVFDIKTLASVIGSEAAAKEAVVYHYTHAASGFSARLTPKQVADLSERFPHLRRRSNSAAQTPLQQLMSISAAFKNETKGPLESFIYKCIPIYDEDMKDAAASFAIEDTYDPNLPVDESQLDGENPQVQRTKSIPPNHATMFNLLKLTKISAKWVKLLIFGILKQVFPRVAYLEQQKRHNEETMALFYSLAGYVEYCDFIGKCKAWPLDESTSFNNGKPPIMGDKPPLVDEVWHESPLITVAKMGLYEYVDKILKAYPQSINVVDVHGRNILQVAIHLRSKKMFDLFASKLSRGRNPLLPSPMFYARDNNNNTILHYAAEVTVDEEEAGPLQMQKDLRWFERVEKLMPRELWYSRNAEGKTAQESFWEKHKKMAGKCKEQLIQSGKIGSTLAAAFVWASSIYLPGFVGSRGGDDINNNAAFFVFRHTIVFGFFCAATAMFLFFSLVTSSYTEHEFRQTIETKFFLAVLSFNLALIFILVAFACSMFL